MRRIHVGLPVADLDAAIDFYTTLFGEAPSKRREGYARFTPEAPAVNLALTLHRDARAAPGQHFGIQVGDADAVRAAARRLEQAGLRAENQDEVDCCYAVQVKTWVTDPDGRAWEIFYTRDEGQTLSPDGACCVPGATGESRCC